MFDTCTMYCFSTSNIVYNLHFLNGTCNSSDTIFRHQTETESLTLHIVLALLCLLLSLITHLRYNSICVLNVTLRSSIISNGLWMIYFTILSLRSVVGAVMYVPDPTCKNPAASRHQLTACLIIADAALRPLEVLCLCRALQHQFLFRSQGILQQEIHIYNSQEDSFSGTEPGSSMSERTEKNDSGALLLAQFILAVVFIILLLALTPEVTVGIYWIYLCLYWIQCITSVILAILIVTNKNEDGPTFLVKLSFLVGVFFSLPGDVPSFIWSCISYSHASIGYCFALAFSFLSVLFLFIALRAEFLRLKQEAQYHAIGGEVDSLFSVHSETITAS